MGVRSGAAVLSQGDVYLENGVGMEGKREGLCRIKMMGKGRWFVK
jgi:hypothetical protein